MKNRISELLNSYKYEIEIIEDDLSERSHSCNSYLVGKRAALIEFVLALEELLEDTREEAIEKLPSVTQKSGEWISVSEKSAKAPCLASDNYANQPFVVTEVITETYEDGSVRCFDAKGFQFGMAAEWPKREIIAWMPLPKPFEPQESEEQTE